MDKRERVARAICERHCNNWSDMSPSDRLGYFADADAAIAALEPVTVQEAARVQELEAGIKRYLEAKADNAGGAPDKWRERQEAFLSLRALIDWPTKASCAALKQAGER